MTNPLIIDAHCDTIPKLIATGESLYSNNLHVDLARIKQCSTAFVQFFAAFVAPSYCPDNAYARCMEIIGKFKEEIAANRKHIEHAISYTQITDTLTQGKIAAVLTIENGAALEGDMAKLDEFYSLGVRSICLTWNGSNQIAAGIGGDELTTGLTPFGFDVVRRMNELGMLVDVSHINEASYWDVIASSTAPIIASHSNSKAMCNHRRNLTDEQFTALIKNGGVTGINLCPPFLNEVPMASQSDVHASMDDILRHIEHLMSLGGENNIGMGADLDGIGSLPIGITGAQDLSGIFNALLSKNYLEEQVRKIAGLNFARVMDMVLK